MNHVSRIANIGKQCVACGCCQGVCPKGAVLVVSGVIAQVDSAACIGCGKCAKVCPAAVITIIEQGAAL